jgi:hypothetical protein
MKQNTKQQDMNRIRTKGPLEEDLTDERPRVRRAALVQMAQSNDPVERSNALKIASHDASDVVYLGTMRGYLMGGARSLLSYPGAVLE